MSQQDRLGIRGKWVSVTNQVLFKLSEVSLGSDGIISLEYGEFLDSIIRNVMRSTSYLRKFKGFIKFHHFLRLEGMTLQICDGYLRGIALLNFQSFYEKSAYSIFP